MDARSTAPVPSSSGYGRRRRQIYLIIACFLGLALAAYYIQAPTTHQDVSIVPTLEELRPCDDDEPIRRIAVIGTYLVPQSRLPPCTRSAHLNEHILKATYSIGAGSAGSSAAYYLSKYAGHCNRLNITIYERSSYIGGRSTTVNVFDSPSEPVELGASIFVKVNQNLVDAVKAFGLSTRAFSREEEEYDHDLGIYDGQEWVYIQNNNDSFWWNAAKLLWRYGTAPIRTRNLMKSTTGKFFKMYDAPYFPFRDLSQVVYDVGLTDVTAVTGEELLKQHGIGEQFGRELIQASTRVNYAQNLDTIHGLETMVCMATEGAMSVEGGNWRIFANMVIASKADVKLETSVTGVALQKDGTFSLTERSHGSGEATLESTNTANYDHVILAAPLQYANLTITPRPVRPPSEIPYVNLHVTLFTSPYRLNPLAFRLSQTDHVPATVLTTLPRKGIHATPPFYSISTLRSLINPTTHKREYLYKIFSSTPLSHNYLNSILDSDENRGQRQHGIDRLHSDHVTWKYEKLWQSYPVESPRVTFEELVIDLEEEEEEEEQRVSTTAGIKEKTAPTDIGRLWYTSGIEGFISTMETSSLMGKNVAKLIVDGWKPGKEETAGRGKEEQVFRAGDAHGQHPATEEL